MTLPNPTRAADNDQESGHQHGQAAAQRDTTHFQSRAHKLATLIMMTTGSANAAMFPMMFIFYGGVPFLLAYLVLLATVAMPMMQLESNLAQFAGDGNCGVFSTVPLFLGTGYALTLYVVLRVVADSLPLSDVLLQMVGLGESTVPWSGSCPGGWTANNRTCYAIRQGSVPCRLLRGRLVDSFQRMALGEGMPLLHGDQVVLVPSKSYHHDAAGCMPYLYTPAPTYDFRRQQSWVEHTFDYIRAQPLLSMAAIWALVFALAHGGFIRLKNFFYVMLALHVATTTMLLLRALALEGATRGLHAFAYADWSHIASVEMWSQALYTCLESVGVTGTIYLSVQRFNSLKNNYHEDVMFVLVADTASKAISTYMAFLYLGHLSASMDVDVKMLIDYGSSFIVSITPQALSLAPHPEIWSQVHRLWLLSTMVPKFLIVPDIIIEALSAPYPFILQHRPVAHFMICSLMFIISIVGCSSGGASVVSVLAHTQGQGFRLLMVALETLVILQFYGARRLSIDAHAMTNRHPSTFVKICWTSVVPLVIAGLMWGKVMCSSWPGYPLWLTFIIVWFGSLEFSFIPVFAVTLLDSTKLKPKQSVAPLPVRVPSNWEQAMVYRQQIAVEVIDIRKVLEKRSTVIAASQPEVAPATGRQHKTPDSNTPPQSDTEHMASDVYVASDRSKRGVESPSDWRYFSIGDESPPPRKSKKRRASRKGAQETGTLHESRRLSSLRRLARWDQNVPAKPTKGRAVAIIVSTPKPVLAEAPKTLNSDPPVVTTAVPAVFLAEPVDNVMPTAAARDKGSNEGSDSFDDLDFVGDSAPVSILPAPAPSTDAALPKPSTEQLALIVKSFEDDHDNPDFLKLCQNAASGPKSAHLGEPARPTSDLSVAAHTPVTASATPARACASTSQAHDEIYGPLVPQAGQDVVAEVGAAGRGEERRVASVPSDKRPTHVRKVSRKRSVSRSSSTSSQKPGSFATAGQSVPPVPQATTQTSSSVASVKATSSDLVSQAAAAPGKWSHDKRQRMSKLSLTSHKLPSDDLQSHFQAAKSTTDHELNKSASGPNGSAQHGAALAGGAASTGRPSDIGGAGGELKQAVHDEASIKQAVHAQPGSPGKTPHTAEAASDVAKSTVTGTEGVEGHSGKYKPTSSDLREEGTKSVASSKAEHLDAGTVTAASQPEATDDSKQSGGKTSRWFRKLPVGHKRRSRRERLSRKSLDSNQSVEDAATSRATDVSAVSAESAAREPGISVSPSLASVAGALMTQLAKPHALEIEAASGLFQQQATMGLGQQASAAPPPTVVVQKSADVQSLKESRDASGKSKAQRKPHSRRSKQLRKTSDQQDDHESGHQ